MFSLNCRGRILNLDHPKIMGVLNLTLIASPMEESTRVCTQL